MDDSEKLKKMNNDLMLKTAILENENKEYRKEIEQLKNKLRFMNDKLINKNQKIITLKKSIDNLKIMKFPEFTF